MNFAHAVACHVAQGTHNVGRTRYMFETTQAIGPSCTAREPQNGNDYSKHKILKQFNGSVRKITTYIGLGHYSYRKTGVGFVDVVVLCIQNADNNGH